MVGLDFALIPTFGLEGAAIASVLGSIAGLVVCLIHLKRHLGMELSALIPRGADARRLLGALTEIAEDDAVGVRIS